MPQTVAELTGDSDPILAYRFLVDVQGVPPQDPLARQARLKIRQSARVGALLAGCSERNAPALHPYSKWMGAHWVLSLLAEWRYPPGDAALVPLREQELNWLFSAAHQKHIRSIDGRTRRCASQEGNALYSLLTLGIADERCDELARRLVAWQWPDGGWNCDKHPAAAHSSFHESLIPLRALALHARLTGNADSKRAAERAAEIFLTRRLFRRLKDGSIMDARFLELHYPFYWHYDVLFGLVVLAEGGWIGDSRCTEALDWLESRRLPDGNFPAESRWYTVTRRKTSGRSAVDWGATSGKSPNPFVSVLARFVVRAAGRA